jgi:hypothetical protein
LAITATGEHLREAIRELSPAHHAPANS